MLGEEGGVPACRQPDDAEVAGEGVDYFQSLAAYGAGGAEDGDPLYYIAHTT